MSTHENSQQKIRTPKERRVISDWPYEPRPIHRGYTGRTLHVDLSERTCSERPVTDEMKELFVGGKGFGLRLLWDATTPATRWDDPENAIVISPGPCAGITQYAGAGKSLVVTLSPLTDIVVDSNVGGYFGPYLKFSGWDAIEVRGKAAGSYGEEESVLFVDGVENRVQVLSIPGLSLDSHLLAEELTELFSESEKDKVNIAVVSSGAGARHSFLGMLNFSFFDPRRGVTRLKQAGRGGIGRVFADKGLRAIVCRASGVGPNRNDVADIRAISERGRRFAREIQDLDDKQCEMRTKGTAHLMEIMNEYDLLPTRNFKYGGNHDKIAGLHSEVLKRKFDLRYKNLDGCWFGCHMSCCKAVSDFELRTGPYAGQMVTVDGPEYETAAGIGSNIDVFDADWVIEHNFYCDTYGIDTISWGTTVAFLMECYEYGILDRGRTGGLELTWGNAPAALELLHQLARGEGFGAVAGLGVRRLKELFAREYGADPALLADIGMENKGLEYSQYVSKESLAQQGGYAMTNKGPQHDEAWLIFMDMVNNQIPTFEDKAEALHYFPMFRTWFGLCGFCKLPWNDVEPANNRQTAEPAKVPEHVDNYVTVFGAVTGRTIDKAELIRQSERVYNFQRIFNIRRGYGRRRHDAQPYRACGPVTAEEYESRAARYDKQLVDLVGLPEEAVRAMSTAEKLADLRRYREGRYELLLDAVYERRGWTRDGVPTVEHLERIGMALPELLDVLRSTRELETPPPA